MKKKYVKPVFVFESFSLNTNIAGGCGVPTNTPSYNDCGYDFGGTMIFIEGVGGCDFIVSPDEGPNTNICYHNPTDENNLFNS